MITIKASFKRPAENTTIDLRPTANLIAPIVRFLQKNDPFGAEWFLSRGSLEESLLYPAFDSFGELTTAAEAVLKASSKQKTVRSISVWNGQIEQENGASLSLIVNNSDWPEWSFKIEYAKLDFARLNGLEGVQKLVTLIATTLRPSYMTIARYQYFEKQVFQDRPGVGWMLYLPRVLTTQQVPEARALVPVMGKDEKGRDKQTGTIVVSVTGEPFSDENPEHVKIANAIEIRLVDQDLLPRFSDL